MVGFPINIFWHRFFIQFTKQHCSRNPPGMEGSVSQVSSEYWAPNILKEKRKQKIEL